MIAYWIIFTVVLIAIPFGWAGLYRFASLHKKPTKQEKQAFANNVIILSAFIVLVDCFYMTCFNKWNTASYVLGAFLTLIVFYNLWNVFVSSKERSPIEKWSSLLDFVVGIGVSVYLIYIVQDDVLRNILTSVVAAIYGGMLTLAGVVLTIRWTNKRSEEQHLLSIRPFFYGSLNRNGHDGDSKSVAKPFGDYEGCTAFVPLGLFENSDKVEFSLREVLINDLSFPCVSDGVVAKREVFYPCVYDREIASLKPCSFVLRVEDIDGRPLAYSVTLKWVGNYPVVEKIEMIKEA